MSFKLLKWRLSLPSITSHKKSWWISSTEVIKVHIMKSLKGIWDRHCCLGKLSFLKNLRSTKFHSIITSSYQVIVDHIICLLTCKPTDVTNFAVFAIVSPNFYDRWTTFDAILNFFECRYLWNQKRYQETVNSLLSSFACTIISEKKYFRFISTLS